MTNFGADVERLFFAEGLRPDAEVGHLTYLLDQRAHQSGKWPHQKHETIEVTFDHGHYKQLRMGYLGEDDEGIVPLPHVILEHTDGFVESFIYDPQAANPNESVSCVTPEDDEPTDKPETAERLIWTLRYAFDMLREGDAGLKVTYLGDIYHDQP